MDENFRFLIERMDEHQSWEHAQLNSINNEIIQLRIDMAKMKDWKVMISKRDATLMAVMGSIGTIVATHLISYVKTHFIG